MAISKETTFTDGVTVVTAAWLNLLQEHLAGLATLRIEKATATQIRVAAGDDDDAAAAYIGGEQRFRDTSVSFTFSTQAAGTYGVYLTAPSGSDAFNLTVTSGTPTTTPYRKIGEVDWDGAAISAIRNFVGWDEDHAHDPLDGSGVLPHGDFTGLSADDHTQYVLADGSRAFTAPVSGVSPATGAGLATKGYVDAVAVPGFPVGSIMPFAGGSGDLPSGWLLCDGSAVSRTTYADLFSVLGTAFGAGDGSTTFNVPDLRQRFPLGKTAAGTGSTLGGTGGTLAHTHTQPTHTHTVGSHTHGTAAHTHTVPTTGSGGSHSHTQGNTGSSGSHTHTGPSHTHGAGTLAVADTGGASVGAVNSSSATPGLYAYVDVDQASDNTSHSHGAGTLSSSSYGPVAGTSSSATASHYHYPSANAVAHTHSAGAVSGSTAAAGTGSTSSSGAHTHTNPSTSTDGAHTHTVGDTGSASPSTDAGGSGNTSAAGDEVTGPADPPFIEMHYAIRAV